jgi:hypothetical protein
MGYFVKEYILNNVIVWVLLGAFALHIAFEIAKRIHYYTGAYYRCTGRMYGCNPRKSGFKCEEETYEVLRCLEKRGYRFLFGAYLPKPDGTTTEVDAIAVGPAGIVVIENKDFSGEVIGLEYDKYWSQERPYAAQRSERERWFYNPIMQNAGHIRAIKRLVGESAPIYSLVVFSDRCQLKVPNLHQQDVRVTQVCKAERTFNALIANTEEIVDEAEIAKAYETLKAYIKPSNKIKRQHVKNCRIAAAN